METKLKVYTAGYFGDGEWLMPYNFEMAKNIKDADIVVFPGGADWNPALYHEGAGKNTSYYSEIDKYQLKIALECITHNKFMIGICRGAQMLCILSGGKLIQHVNNHHYSHLISTYNGKQLTTNSIHHQMFDLASIPDPDAYDMLAWAEAQSLTYLDGNNQEKQFTNGDLYRETLTCEPEIVYFNKIGGFGIQGHPEMHLKIETERFIIDEINIAYAKFQTTKGNLPKFINNRIDHIKKYYFQDTKQTQIIKNNESKKNRNRLLEESGDWRY